MPPEIHQEIKTVTGFAEGQKQTIPTFVMDLTSNVPFDPAFFDHQLTTIAKPEGPTGAVKFVVIGDKMIMFESKSGMHSTVYRFAPTIGINGFPVCAGSINFDFARMDLDRRRIHDYSSTLAEEGLNPADSDLYQRTVLAEKLGEHFRIG
jgi:hypothetical protein